MKISNELELSRSNQMRLPLLWIAVLHGRVRASLAATTGVYTPDDVVQYLLAGADVVMTTSALLEASAYANPCRWVERFARSPKLGSVSRIRGGLSQDKIKNPEAYERANQIKILQGYDAWAS